MREDLVYAVTEEEVTELINSGDDTEIFEGSLLDNYVVYANDDLSYDGESRKYFLIAERFVNTWTSRYELTMTDDETKLDEFVDTFSFGEED